VEKGFRFITYAVWWIRQAIIKAIQEKGRMIRLPCNKANELTKIDKTRQFVQSENSCKNDQDIQEIAAFLNMPPKKAENLMIISQDVVSLDEQASKSNDSPAIKDLIEDDASKTPVDNAINSILRTELEEIINDLEKRAADVIRCRFGLGDKGPQTLKEIGADYNLSRERVRQIEKRALIQLQQSSQKRNLESYIA
jgi:RNA polymerase primary sigma factor